jgi:hypothetical protein
LGGAFFCAGSGHTPHGGGQHAEPKDRPSRLIYLLALDERGEGITGKLMENSTQSRWFQFTLRQLLIGSAVAGLLLALVGRQAIDYRRSSAAAKGIAKLGGSVSWNPEIAENLFRDQTVARITDVHFTNPRLNADQWHSLSAIPHRFGLQIDGQTFTDDSMAQLVGIPLLSCVTLSNTRVTASGVIEFQRKRGDVSVMFGYPHDPDFKTYPAANE